MPRFCKITPWNLRSQHPSEKGPDNYVQGQPVTFNIDIIQQIQEYHTLDDKLELKKIVYGPGMFDYHLVERKEAEEIEKMLLKSENNKVADELSVLSTEVRNLTRLLSTRMR